MYLDTGVQLLQPRRMRDKYTRFHCLLRVESHDMQLTFGPAGNCAKNTCSTAGYNSIMEEACSVCERVTKYKCIKCKVSVCALCAPETAQTVNEVDYSPMKLVGVCQTCQRRPEIDKEANTTADTMPPESHSFPARQNPESNEASQTSETSEASQTSSQKTEQDERSKQQFHRRKQWFREQKLEFINLYKKYKSKAKAVREFKVRYKVELKSSTYNPWIAQELKLRNDPKKSRRPGAGRQASYPEMEKQLHYEFKELRSKGVKVKEWWFRSRCKEIMKEKYPDADFKMSDHWFVRFKARFDLSLRRPTNVAQSHPETLRVNIQQFHRYIRRMAIKTKQDLAGKQDGAIGPWILSDIANMDQTPLEFCFNTKGATYETKGEKTVWTRTTGSGHEKRQCTVQLTVFADGEPRIKPLLIFKGTGKRIPDKELKPTHGVPQGSVLGPLLFLLYINDFNKCSSFFNFHIFADDTNLFCTNRSLSALELSVNENLKSVSSWLVANKLSLNIDKTNFIIFHPRQKAVNHKVILHINGQKLEQVKCIRYLGVYIDCNLTWKNHIQYISKKIKRSVGILSKIRHYVPLAILSQLYYTLIFPYLSYAATTWGNTYLTTLKPLTIHQKKAVRLICFAEFNEHSSPLFFKLGILKLSDVIFLQNALFMHDYHTELCHLFSRGFSSQYTIFIATILD